MERKRLGIDKVALTTYYAVLKTDKVEQENEYIRKLVLVNDSLYQWVVKYYYLTLYIIIN